MDLNFNLNKNLNDNSKSNFISNFINELSDALIYLESISKLKKLPKDAIFYVNEIYPESKYFDCREEKTSDSYGIPIQMVKGAVKPFSKLQLKDDNYYHVINAK